MVRGGTCRGLRRVARTTTEPKNAALWRRGAGPGRRWGGLKKRWGKILLAKLSSEPSADSHPPLFRSPTASPAMPAPTGRPPPTSEVSVMGLGRAHVAARRRVEGSRHPRAVRPRTTPPSPPHEPTMSHLTPLRRPPPLRLPPARRMARAPPPARASRTAPTRRPPPLCPTGRGCRARAPTPRGRPGRAAPPRTPRARPPRAARASSRAAPPPPCARSSRPPRPAATWTRIS